MTKKIIEVWRNCIMVLNMYLRKDGRFESRITTGRVDGKRKYKAFFGKTPDEVAQKVAWFQAASCAGSNENKPFLVIYSEWFSSVSYRIKASTAANYTLKAEKHILPSFGHLNIADISQDLICQFIRKEQDRGLSNRYITDILILMKSIFKYAVRTYRIANPMDGIIMPKKQKQEIRLLTAEEELILERYIAQHQNLTTLGIALSKMTGLRIGELCGLKWEDIDLEKRILTVRRTVQRIQCRNGIFKTRLIVTDPKSESSKRDLPIPECLLAFLRKFQGDPDDFVLSGSEKPLEPRTLQYRFVKILKNGNLPSVHFHALRHMFATKCIRLGFDIKSLSEILGHSGVEITLNRYVHSSFEQKSKFMDQLQFAC